MDDYVGQYYSKSWLRKNVLMQTEEEIRQIDKEVEEEEAAGEEDEEGANDSGGGGDAPREPQQPQQVNGKDQQEESVFSSRRLKTIKSTNSKTKIPVLLDD
jgi:hypothetical protein